MSIKKLSKSWPLWQDNPNSSDENGYSPIHWASCHEHLDIVKRDGLHFIGQLKMGIQNLGPLADDPNAPIKPGNTPIHYAACKGHNKIVKIFAWLADNPNAPNKYGNTPIHLAAKMVQKLSTYIGSFERQS